MTLNPGHYFLTIKKTEDNMETRKIYIRSDKRTKIHIADSTNKETLTIAKTSQF